MNFYRSLFRFYVQFDWNCVLHGTRLAIGRWPKVSPISDDEFVDDWVAPLQDDPEAHGIVHVGAQTATVTVEPLNLPSDRDGS